MTGIQKIFTIFLIIAKNLPIKNFCDTKVDRFIQLHFKLAHEFLIQCHISNFTLERFLLKTP